MQLDLTTLNITHVSNFILLGIVLCTLGWRYRHEPALLIWGGATLLACLGQFLIAIRELIPTELSIIAGNGVLFLAMSVSWVGLQALTRASTPWRTGLALAAMPTVLIALPGLDETAINQRVLIFVIAIMGFNFLLLYSALRADQARQLGTRLLAGLSAVLVLFYAYRISLVLGSNAPNILQTPDYLDTMFASLTLETAKVMLFMYLCFERLEMRLTDMRELDVGSGLPNMRAFAARAISLLAKSGNKAMLLLSIDDLGKIRGVSSKEWQDKMLSDISSQLRQLLHPMTECYGKHDEYFAVLLPAASLEQLLARLQTITHPALGKISLSIGITDYDYAASPRNTVDELLLEAELALQEAQHKGRGQICHADKEAIRLLSEC